jgi:DNA-binding protein HU-beta
MSKTIGKGALIELIATSTGTSKSKTTEHLTALIEIVQNNLARGNKITITGFGTFSARKRAARVGHNPATGTPLKIKAATVPGFKAGTKLKAAAVARK